MFQDKGGQPLEEQGGYVRAILSLPYSGCLLGLRLEKPR
jgi:hypothetical protein